MVFGTDVGVVLRARKGRNILVQSHGLDTKTVLQGATEVAAVLEGDVPTSIELLDTGVGAQASLACGHLRVLGNKYAAVYRLLGSVLVIVVARSHANVFSCLNLASAISRLLVAEAKSVDVSPDRLLKKYAQVYLSLDALVNRGSLDLVGALLEANSQLESLSPEGLKAKRARMAAERSAAAAAAADPKQLRQIGRRVPQPHHDHGRFSFAAPPELTSLQVNMPVYQLPELPQPDRPLPKAPSAAPGIVPVTEEQPAEQEEKQEGEAEEQQQSEAAPPPLVQYVGPRLLLREAWQVEVVGSRITRAGLVGAVSWAAPEAKALSGSMPFKLQPPAEAPPQLAAALKSALAATRGAKHGPAIGSFLADSLSALPLTAPLLSYRLPACHAGVLPLMARLSGTVVAHGKAGAVVLLTLQWAVPRELQAAPAGLTVDLLVPPGFAAPRRVEPAGAAWSSSQSLLRWQLGEAQPGAAGACVAAFRVGDGPEAAGAGLPRCHALLRLAGAAGSTLTGVQLAQARAVTAAPALEPGSSSWSAFVLARPAA